tara:strand:+ start:195 stop:1121 length:927 start_codon:yes stop_codon:yes gene_type:complete
MGIKHLNSYLKKHCSKGINKISLKKLSGKKIAIDTSIYLYRFIAENALIENFKLMISIFRDLNITPLFVFDGKPPKEKYELLKERKNDKYIAENKYNQLREQLEKYKEDKNINDIEIKKIKQDMKLLKRQFIRIRHTDIENVKNLIKTMGVTYIDAIGESDKLCAKLVSKNKVFACLSEDMDLFVYGCDIVLKYINLYNKTIVIYNIRHILLELNFTLHDFKHICIISGTDYNSNYNSKYNLFKTIEYFKSYKNYNTNNNTFYEWLDKNTDYIIDLHKLNNILSIFNLLNMPEYKQYESIEIKNINIS